MAPHLYTTAASRDPGTPPDGIPDRTPGMGHRMGLRRSTCTGTTWATSVHRMWCARWSIDMRGLVMYLDVYQQSTYGDVLGYEVYGLLGLSGLWDSVG